MGILVGAAGAVLLTLRVVRAIKASRRELRHLKAAEAAQARSWATYTDRHDQITAQVIACETDFDVMFSKPALNDPSIPVIGMAWEAWRTVQALDREMPQGLDPDCDITSLPYPRAVENLVAAWQKADDYATKIGQDMVPVKERATIQEIQHLLSLAGSGGASDHERQLAYTRASKLMRTLRSVRVPDRALTQLTTRAAARQITAAATT